MFFLERERDSFLKNGKMDVLNFNIKIRENGNEESRSIKYIWTTPANLKIQLKPSMSEIRNYLVANPIF